MTGKPLIITSRHPPKDGNFMVGYDTKFMVGEEELAGVCKADIKFRVNDLVRAKLEIYIGHIEISGVKTEIIGKGVLEVPKDSPARYALSRSVASGLERNERMRLQKRYQTRCHRFNRAVDRAYFALKG